MDPYVAKGLVILFLAVLTVVPQSSSLLIASASALPSYGQLAQLTVPALYNNSLSLLPVLTPSVQPTDVKACRKSILYLRDSLDVFAWAYPASSKTFKKGDDPLVYIRGKLDEGYETIGQFQDLAASKVNYTQKELDDLRALVLAWKANFLSKAADHDFAAYFAKPLLNSVATDRDPKDLSKYYWRDTGIVPETNHSGMWNLVLLLRGVLVGASETYGPLTRVSDILDEAQQVQVHSYRKQLRAIQGLSSMFTLYANTTDTRSAAATLKDAYSGIGDLEDLINAYLFYEKHGPAKSFEKAMQALLDEWGQLLAWLLTGEVLVAIGTVMGALLSFP